MVEIKMGDEVILTLSETKLKIIMDAISSDIVMEDISKRLCWILCHKMDRQMERLKTEWCKPRNEYDLDEKGNEKLDENGESIVLFFRSKLEANGVTSIPMDDLELAELIFAQPNYKDRKDRDVEAEIAEAKKLEELASKEDIT